MYNKVFPFLGRRLFLIGGGFAGVALLCLVCFLGCSPQSDPWLDEPGQPRVVVTIAPLASFVHAVAGDRVAVKCLCTTTGPHGYQLDTRDARVLAKADLLLAVGLRLDDSFADGLRSVARRPDLRYVKLGHKLPDKTLMELMHAHEHNPDDDHHHHHGKWDPHVWLGTAEAVAMVEAIRDELATIDAGHADDYRKNAAAYVEKLKKLDADGKALLKDKKTRRIISFHEALGYFARSMGLTIADVIEIGPGTNPSPKHLLKIVSLCLDEANPIGAITVEPQYAKASANAIKAELAAKKRSVEFVEIDPLETAEPADLKREGGEWYLSRMRKNIEALARTLP